MTTFFDAANRTTVAKIATCYMLAISLSIFLLGCQSIPDISSWTQATKSVTSSATTAFQSAKDVNDGIATRLSSTTKPELRSIADRYEVAAKYIGERGAMYEQLFSAISDYSESLELIAKASDNSQKSVDAVAGAVGQFVQTAGIAFAPISAPIGDAIKVLANEVIKIKAAQDFGSAVQKADPIIGQISGYLVQDLESLKKTVGSTKEISILEAYESRYAKELEFRRALERRRVDLQSAIRSGVTVISVGGSTTSAPISTVQSASDELLVVEQHLQATDTWYKSLQNEISIALLKVKKTNDLIDESIKLVKVWKDSHESLAIGIKARRAPDSARLAALAVKIQKIVNDIEKENK